MIPDLVISIVNHSNPQLLRDCLRSILTLSPGIPGEGRGEVSVGERKVLGNSTHPHPSSLPQFRARETTSFEIHVIDNATDQHLVKEIQFEFPAVKWIFNKNRLGFSANHNQVLATASSRYLCILNDDTIIRQNALATLVQYLDENPKAGMAGPRTLNTDGSIQNSTFRAKTLTGELIDILQLPGGLNRLKIRGIDPAQFHGQPANVDWLLGACIVIRRETLEQIGLLDDVLSPIANCEEVDWCDRVRKAGWEIAFVPEARMTHLGGQSLKSGSTGPDRFRIEMHRVTIAYFRKQHGLISSLLLRAIYIMSLPWNGFMLGQSALRGRLPKSEAKAIWSTLLGIARIALTPLKKPYCRPSVAAAPASSTQNGDAVIAAAKSALIA